MRPIPRSIPNSDEHLRRRACVTCLGGLCRVNPTNGLVFGDQMPEGYDPKPGDGEKNVMVVGAGPAGMEAARVCAERGYNVSVYEKGELGGLLTFAEAIKGGHEQLGRYKNYLVRSLEVQGVNVVTGQEVDADFVRAQNPDVVIVATGGVRPQISLEGTSATPVYSIDDVLTADLGERVVVLGFGAQATDTAIHLMSLGKKVTVVSSAPEEAFATGQSFMMLNYTKPAFFSAGGRIMPESAVTRVGDGEVFVMGPAGVEMSVACDAVVDASNMEPNTELADALSGEFEVIAVGDCAAPSNIQAAVTTANLAARNC